MKCLNCKNKFEPQRNGQSVCSSGCAYEYQVKKSDKSWKKRKKVIKEKSKTLTDHKNDLQKLVNACIREIDSGFNCISCGANEPSDAGHYRSRGAHPKLRFDPFNIWLQCRACNGYKGGRPIEMREGLIDRYGIEHTEAFLDPSPTFSKLMIHEVTELKKVAKNFLKYIREEDKHYSVEETIMLRQDLLEDMKRSIKINLQ